MKQDVAIVMLFLENLKMNKDLYYMNEAFIEAKKAYQMNEVPVGCVIVYEDKIIARAHNLRHSKKCSIYHGEILAIKEASEALDRWILSGCTMYVTIEPCIMCAGAILQSRIDKVVYGTKEERFGSTYEIFNDALQKQGHKVEIVSGIMANEISDLMKQFFKDIREEK